MNNTHGNTTHIQPTETTKFQTTAQRLARNRVAIANEIRARKVNKRAAWEALSDSYLETLEKWDIHVGE